MKLLGLFLIRCVFTKKILGGQKFVKTGTGKDRGFPEHCALVIILLFLIPILIAVRKETADFLSIFEHFGNIFATFQLMKYSKNGCQNHWHLQFLADQLTFFQPVQ